MMAAHLIEIEAGRGKNRRKLRVEIPSDADLIAAAIELRDLGDRTAPAAGRYGECVAVYIPPRQYTIQSYDPFTGEQGPIEDGGTVPEHCIFFHDAGTSVVYAYYDGDPVSLMNRGTRVPPPPPGLFEEGPTALIEGARSTTLETSLERNPALRKLCLDAKGCSCVVCGMTFRARYGEAADGLIHVHHLEPLGIVGRAHTVTPLTDLVPACPNCHAVMHRRTPPYSPDEVREMLRFRT